MSSIGIKRLKITRGITVSKKTGCGTMYITINSNGDGKVIEIFTHLGKNGDCVRCQNEAITKAITLGLRAGVPLEEYISKFRGIQCSSPNLWPLEERTLSCPDAIAQVLQMAKEGVLDESK